MSSGGGQSCILMRLAENLQEKLKCTDFQVDLESTYAVDSASDLHVSVASCISQELG